MNFSGVRASFGRLVLLCVAIVLTIGAGKKDDDSAAVEEAMKHLQSADWKERRDAEQQLVDIGEPAARAIKRVLPDTKDAETRTHLDAALRRIDQNDRIGASVVTLHLKNSSPEDALEALNAQSRVPLTPQPENLFDQGPWPPADVEIVRRPYWEAVRLLCQKFAVEPRAMNDGLHLQRAGDGHGEFDGPFVIDGPFLIAANTIYRNVAIHLADPAAPPPAVADAPLENFALQFTAFAEPKLAVLRCDGAVTLDEATDETGHSLLPPAGATGIESDSGGKGAWTLHAPLVYPLDHPGKRIAKLKGSTSFLVRTKSQKVEIPNISAAREVHQLVGELPLTIKDFKRTVDRYELRLSLSLDVLQEKSWSGVQQSMQSDLHILDADGHPLIPKGFRSRSGDTNDEVEFILGFVREASPGEHEDADHDIGEPSKLVWDVPVETQSCVVHFEFKDLPMP